ncbi:MAG: hypothetical protein A2081_02080 [Elusimicrobia bacterium GWC2_61_19]|nr:MAG: hypothetical protein A2081_02080 [Elusimicrobia bacterium GWC2_61_19]
MEKKLNDLIARGNAFREDFLTGSRYRWYRHPAPNADYAGWKNDCLLFVRKAFGGESRYYTELAAVENGNSMRAPGSVFSFFVGTLRRAQTDLPAAHGAARAASPTGLAEDLLGRAEDMVGKGHYVSAAALAGAVLEDLLRRLCAASGVFCAENATLENVNDRLLAAGVYNSAWHRETALRIGLRRTAEHCYIEKLNADNVSAMIAWLRGFSGRKFSAAGAAAVTRS